MATYSKKVVKRICDLHKKDSFTVTEICEDIGIAESTYYKWLSTKVEFSDAVEQAKQQFKDELLPDARKSLKKLVQGYTVTETRTVTADTGKKSEEGKAIVKVKEHTKTEKHFQPSLGAVTFALTNADPDNWKNRQDTNVSADVTLKSELDNLSDDELEIIINGGKLETSEDKEA